MCSSAVHADPHNPGSGGTAPAPPPAGGDISSTSNPYIKHCVKLRESARYRQQQRRLLVVGDTLLAELAGAAHGSLQAVVVFVKPSADVPAWVSCESVVTVTDNVMRKLTGLEETGGVQLAAELRMPAFVDLLQGAAGPQQKQPKPQQQPHLQEPPPPPPQQQQQPRSSHTPQLQRLLVLDGVQDPGNLGTLLRGAAAFGWDAVWLLPGCCDPFNDKALRASRGAAFKVRLAAGGLQQLRQVVAQHGLLLIAAEPEEGQAGGTGGGAAGSRSGGDSSTAVTAAPAAAASGATEAVANSSNDGNAGDSGSSSDSSRPVALVLGAEGSGLSADVLAAATPVAIPMAPDAMESLNVAVAGSILMFVLSGGLPSLCARLQQLRVLP